MLVLKKSHRSRFIVWSSAPAAERVLDAAQRAGLLAERHAYLVVAPDLRTRPLAAYSHGGANVTALALFDVDSPRVRAVMAAWRAALAARLGDQLDAREAARVQAAPPSALLLAYDGAWRTARALRHLSLPNVARAVRPGCALGAAAFHADTLLNYLRSEEKEGATLEVTELVRGGSMRRVGTWARGVGVAWERAAGEPLDLPQDSMANRTFTVLIAMNKPYVMQQESKVRLAGNARYEGFCIELIEELARLLHFNYTFLEHRGGYGSYNETTGQWDGMTGRLMDDPAVDFAVTDLTITAERERAVDFTTPFMNLGISILFRKPEKPPPETFAFLLPFSPGVWLALALAYVGSSLVLFAAGRLCPDEWQNSYPCVEEPLALENQFTLGNAFWFNLGAVLLQGSEIAPIAYGTRAAAGAWWLFALVVTSSYTANLATLLAKEAATETIRDVRDLVGNEQGIQYGAKLGGSTYTFFKDSQSDIYKKMYEYMKDQKMPASNEEAIEWVKAENYAFLMESTSIEYVVERDCDVIKVGELLDSKGYGVAMKKGSPYRQEMNLALLRLQEGGVLRRMKESWWREKHGGGACKEVERESEKLSMSNFLGLFLVLAVGSALGVLVSLCELVLTAARRPRDPARPVRPFARRLAAELRFVFSFERSVKPLQGSLSDTPSGSSERSAGADEQLETEGADGERNAADERQREAECAAQRQGSSRARRRSSMHAASVRLARHAQRSSTPPAPH